MSWIGYSSAAAVIVAAAILSGCSSNLSTIAADDEALCRYSADAGAANTYSTCLMRLESRRVEVASRVADRIEGYALLNAPAPANDVAERCKGPYPPAECADVTGAIPAKPSH